MLRVNATLAKADTECNTNCAGNAAQKCGSGGRLSVYSSQNPLKIIKKAAPIQKVGNWTYQGCATNIGGQWLKPLPWKLTNQTGNTPEWCTSRCQKYGYMAAGLEYGVEWYVTCQIFSMHDLINSQLLWRSRSHDCCGLQTSCRNRMQHRVSW